MFFFLYLRKIKLPNITYIFSLNNIYRVLERHMLQSCPQCVGQFSDFEKQVYGSLEKL